MLLEMIKRVVIVVRYNIIGYLVGEGFRNVLKNKKATSASLVVMCLTMIIFGVFFAIGQNIEHMMEELQHSQGIAVFIKDEATEEQIKEIGEKIKQLEGVHIVEFRTKDDAMEKMRKKFEGKQHLLEGISKEIFSVSYEVRFTDLKYISKVVDEINKIDNIKGITNKEETVTSLMNIGKTVKIITSVLLICLIIFSIFIISNTIKLTVHARRKEISIMKYVGATNSFIRWPFIIEGIVIGITSAIISVLVVGGGYNLISEKLINTKILESGEISLLAFNDIIGLIILVYIILGIGIGVVGSSISMRKYLDV